MDNLFSSSAPQAQPFVNTQTSMNDLANMTAMNKAREAATASAVQDIQDKRRAMQLSMLGGILNEPDPQKQSELASKLIPIANKLNPSFQIDENASPETLRALMMSQVPVEQLPAYQMNMAKANFYQGLAGQPVQPTQALAQSPTQSQQPGATPAEVNPQGGVLDRMTPTQKQAFAIFDPQGSAALVNQERLDQDHKRLQYESPQGKGQASYNTKSGDQLAANNAEMQILQTQLKGYEMALQPDPALGGKSPAELAPGGEMGKLQTEFTNAYPHAPIISDPAAAQAYTKLQNLLNPAAAEAAKANFNRVTGQEYKTFQSSQGMDAAPDYRPKIIQQSIQKIQERMQQLQQENKRLSGQIGVQEPQQEQQGAAGQVQATLQRRQQPSQLSVQDQMASIMAAKQAAARATPQQKAAIKQRLIDHGINPSLAGL